MKSRVDIMAIHYCMLELVFLKVRSHTDTVHVAEDASESAFIRYPGSDEIVTGSPQNAKLRVHAVPAGICGQNPRKLAQEIVAENNKKCGEKCGTCQELAELLADNCGFGPNHNICCILRIAICVLCK